ncbi:MAG: PIN domain-containing protein [Chloroflexota bacterium]|nr:PIN domain-containing protein [Chloroflexota bacterium]
MTAILPTGRRAVLADAGPLFAISDDRDQHHARARSDLDRLRQEQRSIVLPYPLLWECYSVLLRHHPLSRAQSWLGEVGKASYVIAPEADDVAAAMQLPARYRDQPITLFDAILAVMSDRLRLPVWTFDHHFDVMRVDVWR